MPEMQVVPSSTTLSAAHRLDVPSPFTTDWCLIDVVQRCRGRRLEFTLLEGLTKVKRGHWVDRMAPELAEDLAAAGMRAFCVYQIGRGILPRQYWLDDANRVVLILSNAVMWVLDDDAQQKVEDLVVELIAGGVHYEY